jgi:hypothetical protein
VASSSFEKSPLWGVGGLGGLVLGVGGLPFEFAGVTLLLRDSVVAFTFTDSVGSFRFDNVTENIYDVEISYLGYKTDTVRNIAINGGNIILPDYTLTQLPNTLDNVTITASKPIIERKPDRIVFNVENSVYAEGADALLALSKAPRVQVQNDDIQVLGKGTAAVLINDKLLHLSGEELSNYLRSLPSGDIQKI